MSTIQRSSENQMPSNTDTATVTELKTGKSGELKAMSTIQRSSENQMPANTADTAPELKKSKNIAQKGTPENLDAFSRTSDFIAAWGAGRFNSEDTDAVYAALAEFCTEDAIVDASSAAHSGIPEYKVHHGFAGMKVWFDFLGSFSFEGIEMSQVKGPSPNEVWMRFSSPKSVCKATGKSTSGHSISVFTWEGGMCTKLTNILYNPALIAAICSEEDVPIPPTVQLPAFEPHPSPMEPFAEIMALWGAGELNKAEVRREHFVVDAVDDLTDPALPDVLKAYRGIDGTGVWMDYVSSTLEVSNVEVVPVVGLKPGCVIAYMTWDMKHKTTSKEAKGVQQYNELAYDVHGKLVYARHYWVNAPLLASIY